MAKKRVNRYPLSVPADGAGAEKSSANVSELAGNWAWTGVKDRFLWTVFPENFSAVFLLLSG
jgi:hypothetical protein